MSVDCLKVFLLQVEGLKILWFVHFDLDLCVVGKDVMHRQGDLSRNWVEPLLVLQFLNTLDMLSLLNFLLVHLRRFID
jgi:hypothetical protein